jgi:3-oxoacyl-[acyl-carrier-protein] synthase III
MSAHLSYGVVATGRAVGALESVDDAAPRYTRDLQKIRSWGYRTFHRADDGTGLTDLAEQAGRTALASADLSPSDVDVLVLATAEVPEYLYWDPSAACQGRLGAHRAEAVLATQACSAGVAAFDLVAGKFATHPEYQVALLLTAHRVCETYRNRMESDTSVSSDGAAAAVLVRGHAGCRWLATEVITDGRYAHLARLPGGGAAQPFSARHPDPGMLVNPFDRLEEYFGTDLRAMLDFSTSVGTNGRAVIERACARAGVTPQEIRYGLHLNENAGALSKYAARLGLPVEATNAAVAAEHGHFGCADQVFALSLLLEQGVAQPGDLVALTSTGNGMHWACTLLRI